MIAKNRINIINFAAKLKKLNEKRSKIWFHAIAIVTSIVWGTTFVSSKVLINNGLTPAEILLMRFVLAYVCILPMAMRRLFAKTWKDELLLVLLGMAGGSVYFLAENTALIYTQASNVSILISITPLLTAVVTSIFYKSEPLKRNLLIGAGVALVGVACVVLNGEFVLKLSPVGDILTIAAASIWVTYGLILKKLQQHEYTSAFITRKVFFYGGITILPVIAAEGGGIHFAALANPIVVGNVVYLGIMASFLGYLAWNYAIDKIGVVSVTNYLYLNPLATFVTAAIVLSEQITWVAIVGGLMILSGVYLTQRK
jgi:drug/metabolite transporter (DMT)-like permease